MDEENTISAADSAISRQSSDPIEHAVIRPVHMGGVKDVYQRHAAAFDRLRNRDLMERPYLEQVRQMVPPPARVLDLGCGAGEPIARDFVDHGYAVTGVDFVPAMLDIARTRFPEQTWLLADMRALSLGQKYDVLVAWDSFFHLDHHDQRQMFAVFRDHAAPGGALLFTSGEHHGEVHGTLCGDPLYHASLDTREYEALLAEHGFRRVMHRIDDPECGHHTVWLARLDT